MIRWPTTSIAVDAADSPWPRRTAAGSSGRCTWTCRRSRSTPTRRPISWPTASRLGPSRWAATSTSPRASTGRAPSTAITCWRTNWPTWRSSPADGSTAAPCSAASRSRPRAWTPCVARPSAYKAVFVGDDFSKLRGAVADYPASTKSMRKEMLQLRLITVLCDTYLKSHGADPAARNASCSSRTCAPRLPRHRQAAGRAPLHDGRLRRHGMSLTPLKAQKQRTRPTPGRRRSARGRRRARWRAPTPHHSPPLASTA